MFGVFISSKKVPTENINEMFQTSSEKVLKQSKTSPKQFQQTFPNNQKRDEKLGNSSKTCCVAIKSTFGVAP